MFNVRKSVQVATWFLRQARSRMPHLKLMRLMYLADRAALDEFGFPVTGDCADWGIALRERSVGRDALDQISAADADVLARVWRQFGNMNKWQIRDYTHDHCPEWEDPQGSSKPIPFERIFTALGRNAEDAAWLAEQIAGEHRVHAVFAALRKHPLPA